MAIIIASTPAFVRLMRTYIARSRLITTLRSMINGLAGNQSSGVIRHSDDADLSRLRTGRYDRIARKRDGKSGSLELGETWFMKSRVTVDAQVLIT